MAVDAGRPWLGGLRRRAGQLDQVATAADALHGIDDMVVLREEDYLSLLSDLVEDLEPKP